MATPEPTVGQLVASVSRDLSALVRSEIELAKAELKDEVKSAGLGGAMFGAAGFVVLFAIVLLSIAAAYGLTALGLHPGWSFLIVAAVYLLAAAVLGLLGLRSFKKIKPPERTIRTAKDTASILKSDSRAEIARR